ncbi:MAG: terpene cyclase/mutase family protein [Chloroflexi bacterium]|nr:terpene cyclase/mutase family protein [Chloroflexota bacterium]
MHIRLLLIFGFLLVHLFPASDTFAQEGGLQASAEWLERQQQLDGGFSNGFAAESDIGTTADAVIALVYLGRDPLELRINRASPIDFLERSISGIKELGPGVAAKVALALNAAGLNPRDFANTNLIDLVLEGFDGDIGMFGFGPFDSGLAISALVALQEDIPEGALEALSKTRFRDGSYAFGLDPNTSTGDSNTTALVVQALIGAGAADEIASSLMYFRNTQNDDHGWTFQKPSEFGEETDANSTALVIQALRFAGEDLNAWGDPLATLLTLQEPSGAFALSISFPGDNILATLQAMITLSGGNYISAPTPVPEEPANKLAQVGIVLVVVLVVLGGAILIKRATAHA